MKISAIINTFNEEKNLPRCINSLKDFVDEIVVVDMNSSDRTIKVAEELGARVFKHDYVGYVEPARNFALRQVSNGEPGRTAQDKWILVIDADEELPQLLAEELKKIVKENKVDYVNLPRKNLIFGKWIKHSRWWPDYNVRFFRKDKVEWNNKIHSIPMTQGRGMEIPAEEKYALVHHNYQTISQYLERNDRYSSVMAIELAKEGYCFSPKDLIKRPFAEFLSRYYAGKGYQDGLHGLVLAILQAVTEFLTYLKVWEKEKFTDQDVDFFAKTTQQSINDLFHWQGKTSSLYQKIRLKLKKSI